MMRRLYCACWFTGIDGPNATEILPGLRLSTYTICINTVLLLSIERISELTEGKFWSNYIILQKMR